MDLIIFITQIFIVRLKVALTDKSHCNSEDRMIMDNKEQSVLVNYLKGISITAIVLYHMVFFYIDVPNIVKQASSFGGAGVHIFIICSGFGLALSNAKKPLTWCQFMRKRFVKIYLPYIIVIIISFSIPFVYVLENRGYALLSHILMYKMFVPQYESSFGVQMWYISTIFQFYFVFYLLVKLKNKLSNKKYFFVSCIISAAWIFFTVTLGIHEERIWGSFFLQYLWEFSIGMCMADVFFCRKEIFFSKIKPFFIFVGALLSGMIFFVMAIRGGVWKSINDIFSVLAFGGICLFLYRKAFLKKVFWAINKFSYEWFLVHILVFEVCFSLLNTIFERTITIGMIALILSAMIAYGYKKIWVQIYKVIK